MIERKSAKYAVIYLRNNIPELEASIKECNDEYIKPHLEMLLNEYRQDLVDIEQYLEEFL